MSEENAAIQELENTLEDLQESEEYWLKEKDKSRMNIAVCRQELDRNRAAQDDIRAALEILRKAE